MKVRNLLLYVAVISMALVVLTACGTTGVTDGSESFMETEIVSETELVTLAKKEKVTVCRYKANKDEWKLLKITEKAVKDSDKEPGDSIELNGVGGYILNAECQPELSIVDLTVVLDGTGIGTVTAATGITCGMDCNESYAGGTTVTLIAEPQVIAESVSIFNGWTGCDSNPTDLSCTVEMTSLKTVTATFNLVTVDLVVNLDGSRLPYLDGAFNSRLHLAEYNDKLYFREASGNLWSYNDQTKTANPVVDVNEATIADVSHLVEYNGQLYFRQGDDFATSELWSYDDLTGEAGPVANGSIILNPSFLTVYNNRLYLRGFQNLQTDGVLWVYDAQTSQANPILDTSGSTLTNVFEKAVYNGKLYFSSDIGNGREVLSYDDQTGILSGLSNDQIGSSQNGFSTYDGKLYLRAYNSGISRDEVWAYDGNTANLVEDLNGFNIAPTDLTEFNGKLYFEVSTSSVGRELWSYDAVTGVVVLAADIIDGSTSSTPRKFTEYNGKLYFGARENLFPYKYELWVLTE